MDLPPLTALQYLVIMLLAGTEKSGAELRRELAERGHKRSGPAFYEMIRRMMNAGWIDGRDVEKTLETGIKVRERRLEVTGEGAAAARTTELFYAQVRKEPAR